MSHSTPRSPAEKTVGRRTLLDEDLETKIVEALRHGAHLSVAARSSGIADRTLHAWLKRGRDELARLEALPDDDDTADVHPVEEKFVRLALACDAAEADSELEAARTFQRAASYDWRAAQKFLAHRHPDRWAPVSSLSVTAAEAEKRVEETAAGILSDLGLGDDDGDELDDTALDAGQP